MLPGVRYSLPNTGQEGEGGGDEYGPAATKYFVEWVGQPAAQYGTT